MPAHDSKRHLSQFFTPQAIVDFMFELVRFEASWKVIDPACGDGAFVTEASRRGAIRVAGIDVDAEAIAVASNRQREGADPLRLYCQDGLVPIADDDPFWQSDFDLAIGNPPFAGGRRRAYDPGSMRHLTLASRSKGRSVAGSTQIETYCSQNIEVLFLERFIQLVRPGGLVALILPVGILASASQRHVRRWLIENHTIHAVIGLPRNAFKSGGTRAKTAIVYLEKRPPQPDHHAMLAEIERFDDAETRSILDAII